MAGMFYSLQQAAEKLNIAKEQVEQLIKDGRLREFQVDGANVVVKADEVEALMSEASTAGSGGVPAEPEQATDTDQISLVPETTEPTAAEAESKSADAAAAGQEISAPGQVDSEAQPTGDEIAETEGAAEEAPLHERGVNVLGETDTEVQPMDDTMEETKGTAEEVSLDEEGVDVLGETDSAMQPIDDTKTETKGTAEEASLEEIEEDVNLDTFGSGSGLLDLSLQADDTSLGGILDEIYTAESDQETREGSALDVAVEAEPMLPEEELAGAEPVPEMPAMAQAYVEPEADTLSNAFGVMLVLPLLAIIYTAIIAIAGFGDVMPAALGKIQGNGPYGIHIVWYVMVGAAVVAMLIVGVASMLGGSDKAGRKPKAAKTQGDATTNS